jgi:hypothetical protein
VARGTERGSVPETAAARGDADFLRMERQTIPRRGVNGADLLMSVLGTNLPATSVRVQVYVGIDPTLIPIRECLLGGETALSAEAGCPIAR